MIFIGIDAGLTGAVASISPGGALVFDIPTTKIGTRSDYNLGGMASMLATLTSGLVDCVVVLEHVQPMPKNGSIAAFSLGSGFGIWRGIIASQGLRLELVRPQVWKKSMLEGRGKDKGVSLQRARELFPTLCDDLTRVKDHGRAEALLLAEYGRRRFAGE